MQPKPKLEGTEVSPSIRAIRSSSGQPPECSPCAHGGRHRLRSWHSPCRAGNVTYHLTLSSYSIGTLRPRSAVEPVDRRRLWRRDQCAHFRGFVSSARCIGLLLQACRSAAAVVGAFRGFPAARTSGGVLHMALGQRDLRSPTVLQ